MIYVILVIGMILNWFVRGGREVLSKSGLSIYILVNIKTPINKGAVALKSAPAPFLRKKIAARPRKNLAVGVKLMYDQTH